MKQKKIGKNILKNISSNGRILGVSIIALFMVMSAISAVVLLAPPVIGDDDLPTPTAPFSQPIEENPPLSPSCGINLTLVLDSSGSMDQNLDIPLIKDAANDTVDALLPDTEAQIGVVEFDASIKSTLEPTNNTSLIKTRINAIVSGGSTNWEAAINEVLNMNQHNDLMIMMTDGTPTTSDSGGTPLYDAIMAANNLKLNGTRIVVIGVDSSGAGTSLNIPNLMAISGNNAVLIPPFGTNTTDDITNETDVIVGDISEVGSMLYNLTTALCDDCNDTTPPEQTVEFGEPKNLTNTPPHPGIGPNTPVWINSTDLGECATGTETLTYMIYINNSPVVGPITVFDDDIGDSNDEFGNISVILSNWTTCSHQIHYACKDRAGNGNDIYTTYNHTDFWVDATEPESTTAFGYPHLYEQYGIMNYTWVNCSTVKYINATDSGCTYPDVSNGAAGIAKIEWKVTVDYEPPFNGIDFFYNGTVYDNDVNDTNPIHGEINFMLTFDEDCLHIVEHRAFDKFGNHENWQKQHLKVDCTPPNITKVVEQPNCYKDLDEDDHDVWCVDLSTDIIFSAEDFGCYWELPPSHPGVGLETFEYHVWNQSHGWTEWIPADPAGETYQFTEECKHYLEIKAVDKLGNTAIDNETFYVDDTFPVIIKTVGDPNCYISDDEYCVTTDTNITIDAYDNGCCDDLTVEYQINGGSWTLVPFLPYNISFCGECNHTLNITAYDCLGHRVFDNETFHVDNSPPIIIKTVGDPHCIIIPQTGPGVADDDDDDFVIQGIPYCVTTDTEITLTANDPGCCPSEITIEYKIDRWDAGGNFIPGTWQTYDGTPITFDEECKHILYVRAYDCLGNGMDDQYWDIEEFRVDDQLPKIDKIVTTPNCTSPNGADFCVKTNTAIYFKAWDEGCCPCEIDFEYRVWNDTDPGCWLNVYNNLQEITVGPYSGYYLFKFGEECFHHLDLRATDCFGRTVYHNETFYVDDTPPIIIKTVGDPNCYISEGEYCVTTDTNITIDAYDNGCCPSLMVEYQINGGSWTLVPFLPYNISFCGECNHTLNITAYDCLGHQVFDNETFHVDNSPPEIIKTVGDPNCFALPQTPPGSTSDDDDDDDSVAPPGGNDVWCVNLSTIISATAENKGCCVDQFITMDYRIWNMSDGWTNWMSYTPGAAIMFEEECKHYLEIRASDCLGNTVIDNETFYVDETPPNITKFVDEINCYEGLDNQGNDVWCVNMNTVITAIATNEDCCVDQFITMDYRIWNMSDGWTNWMSYTPGAAIMFEEECKHYLEIRASDCLGNTVIDNETFYVDETPPPMPVKHVGEPSVYLGIDNETGTDQWIIWDQTEICFNASQEPDGCCQSDVFIEYRVWYNGEWVINWTDYIDCITLSGNCVHYLEARAYDCIGNRGEIDNETFWVCGPGGGTDPHIIIEEPEFGSETDCENDTLRVKINAWDGETPKDELTVRFWIPGGRRNAPTLWYDAQYNETDDCFYGYIDDIYKYQNGAQLTIEAAVIDGDVNVEFAFPTSFEVCSCSIYDYWMQDGWNIINIVDFTGDNSVESVMFSIDGQYDWVFEADTWDSYYTGRPIQSLTEITAGNFYWVHMNNSEGRFYLGECMEEGEPSVSLNKTVWNETAEEWMDETWEYVSDVPSIENTTLFVISDMGQTSPYITKLQAYAIGEDGTDLTFAAEHILPNVGWGAVSMALDDVNNKLFVSYEMNSTVFVFDAETYSEIHKIVTPGGDPAGMVVDTSTNTLYVVDRGQTTIYMYDTITYAFKGTGIISTGAYGLGFDRVHNHLYVTHGSSSISVYDASTFTLQTSYDTGHSPQTGIAVDDTNPANIIFYTTDNTGGPSGNQLTKFETSTSTILYNDTIYCPTGVTVDPSTNMVYITTASPSIEVYNATTLKRVNKIDLPSSWAPTDLFVGEVTFVQDPATFKIEVCNDGEVNLTNVNITDCLPVNLTAVNWYNAQVTSTFGPVTYTQTIWNEGQCSSWEINEEIPIGECITIEFNGLVWSCEEPSGHINFAEVTASYDGDSVSDDDTAIVWGICGELID